MNDQHGDVGNGSVEVANAEMEREAELLAGLNAGLHAMSQPLTALLFLLEYGVGVAGPDEVKGMMTGGLEQCERLIGSMRAMQALVLHAAPNGRAGDEGNRAAVDRQAGALLTGPLYTGQKCMGPTHNRGPNHTGHLNNRA